MIKRILCLIVILAVCFSFAACTACDSSGTGSTIVDAPSTSEGSSEGDDSAQDSSSSASTAQEDDSASQSEGDDSSNSDSGSDSDNADDNSGTGSDDDSSGTGATSAAQTGAGSAQGGFAITAQPVSTSVAVGAPLTLSVSASGSGTLTYQWYTSLTNSYNGIEMIGKTSSTVSLSTSNPFTQYYYCVITQVSTGATLTTNIATASAVGSGTAQTPTPTPTPTPTSYGIWVLGTEVTPANAADVLGDGIVSYDVATNTLTFVDLIVVTSGQALTGDPYRDAGIGANKSLKIQFHGVGSSGVNFHFQTAYSGIYVTGDLEIDIQNAASVNGLYGIYVTGNFTLTSEFSSSQFSVSGANGDANSVHGSTGLYCGGDIVVQATLIVSGGDGYITGDFPTNGGTGIHALGNIEATYGNNEIISTGGQGRGLVDNVGAGGVGIIAASKSGAGSITGIGGAGDPAGAGEVIP